MSSKKILVCIADGTEEIEATVPIDLFRRAAGESNEVIVAKVGGEPDVLLAVGSNRHQMVANVHISAVKEDEFDLIVCPGGYAGSQACGADETLVGMLRAQKASGRLFAAICAAPALVLADNGLLEGVTCCTCYPVDSLRGKLPSLDHADEIVCVDGNCITSQGPGTAFPFALKLIELVFGAEKAGEVQKATLFKM